MGQNTGAPRRRLLTALAIGSALAVLPTVVLAHPTPAEAAGYPSWQDVQNAVANVNANQALQKQVQAQIQQLTAASQAAQAEAERKGDELGVAQQAFDDQDQKVQRLEGDVAAATQKADAAKTQVDGLLQDIAKRGNADLTTTLVTHSGDADNLLYRLGTSSKLAEQTKALYGAAIQQQKTIEKLNDQGKVAKEERQRRQELAQKALEEAEAASARAAAAVDAENQHKGELEAQLTALQQKSLEVRAGYDAGVAAARAAAEAAARARAAAGAAGQINGSTGWARPSGGRITSGYGMRANPWGDGGYAFHTGTDLANGCGANIYAAHSGRITFAGPSGNTLGNLIKMDNGDGFSTEYGHIVNGGFLVRAGDNVDAGQVIAHAGSTGLSTGCHLHFIVRVNGSLTDPVPFMRSHGMPL